MGRVTNPTLGRADNIILGQGDHPSLGRECNPTLRREDNVPFGSVRFSGLPAPIWFGLVTIPIPGSSNSAQFNSGGSVRFAATTLGLPSLVHGTTCRFRV